MVYFAKFSQAKCFFAIFLLLISQQVFSAGFIPKTKVWVQDQEDKSLKFVEIGDLKIGNNCLSLNLEAGKIETTKILDIVAKKEAVKKLTLAVLNNNFDSEKRSLINFVELEVSGEHQFFVPSVQASQLVESWKMAKELKPGNILVKIPGSNQLEDFIAIVVKTESLEEQELICLSLKENHNFFVSELGIIAHNIAPILGITYVFGSGFAPITASQVINGLCFLACAAGIAKNKLFDKSVEEAANLKRFEDEKRQKQEAARIQRESSLQNNSTTGGGGGGGNGGETNWSEFIKKATIAGAFGGAASEGGRQATKATLKIIKRCFKSSLRNKENND